MTNIQVLSSCCTCCWLLVTVFQIRQRFVWRYLCKNKIDFLTWRNIWFMCFFSVSPVVPAPPQPWRKPGWVAWKCWQSNKEQAKVRAQETEEALSELLYILLYIWKSEKKPNFLILDILHVIKCGNAALTAKSGEMDLFGVFCFRYRERWRNQTAGWRNQRSEWVQQSSGVRHDKTEDTSKMVSVC